MAFKAKSHSILSLFECAGDQPSLDLLWFGAGPKVSALRLTSFLSVFDCQELSELYGVIEDSLLAALCLVTYIVLQVVSTFSPFFDSFQWVMKTQPEEIKQRPFTKFKSVLRRVFIEQKSNEFNRKSWKLFV